MNSDKYTWSVNINIKAIIENGFNELDVVDAVILNFLSGFIHSKDCQKHKIQFDGKEYYWFGHNYIIKQLPILRINSKRAIYNRFKKYEDAEIIEPHPNSKELSKSYYSLTPNFSIIINGGYKEGKPMNQTSKAMNQNSKGMEPYFQGPMNQTSNYYNTIDNHYNKSSIDSVGANAPSSVRRKVMELPDKLKKSLDNMVCLETISDELLAEVLPLLKSLDNPAPAIKEKLKESTGAPRREKPKTKGKQRFQPPTLEEAQDYFEEKGVQPREAEKFWNYYEANGWKVGKNKMQKWKSAAAGWISRMKDYAPKRKAGEQETYEERNRKWENIALGSHALYLAKQRQEEENERRYNGY
jgi:hypothetical protein